MALATFQRQAVWGNVLQRVVVGILSGTLAGLVAGVGARLAMRIVALVLYLPPGFTLRSTLVLVLVVTGLGVAPGVVYAVVGRRLPGPAISRGAAFGVLLFVVVEVYPLLAQSSVTEPVIQPRWLRWALFGAVSLVYGLVLGATEAPVGRLLPTARRNPGHAVGYALIALWGLITSAWFLAFLASAEFGVGPVR